MPDIALTKFIAAGCLVLAQSGTGLPDNLWALVEPGCWYHLAPSSPSAPGIDLADSYADSPGQRLLPSAVQNCLLSSPGCLAAYARLLRDRWLHMSFRVSPHVLPPQAIIRVAVLPDDVENSIVPRWKSCPMERQKQRLLARLDYSAATWEGNASPSPSSSPAAFPTPQEPDSLSGAEDESLLHMFNSIPSPRPTPESIEYFDARDAANKLLVSNILGLTTTLYPYQRRSAALMLQREFQKKQIVDPRVVKVVDQLRTTWYYDSVSGRCLREPNHYDAPCGGILAEEMGAGKTLICLALILATRHIPPTPPDEFRTNKPIVRPRVGSLADMAAACITRHSVPWRNVFGDLEPDGVEHPGCLDAIRRNPGVYVDVPSFNPGGHRRGLSPLLPTRVYLSHASLVIVPPNLVQQWKQEITKHTAGLKVLTIENETTLPPIEQLTELDVILFSATRFERLSKKLKHDSRAGHVLHDPLANLHFQRCIVDEGHKLGNSTLGRKSNLLRILDCLRFSARWIVTGTPSKGLFGINDKKSGPKPLDSGQRQLACLQAETSPELEGDDLRRIGSIATLYIKMRPWGNLRVGSGEDSAPWDVYVLQPRHSPRSNGRVDCLRATLESLIIRHRQSDTGDLLPPVHEKIVYLDGSFQDRLVINLFSMMIIFNAIQSQRTDVDYLFHPRQRHALAELVSNLRQATFFGGSFFSPAQISKAIETAEEFLRDGKVQISAEDDALLREAIEFGKRAEKNAIKQAAHLVREVPLYIEHFPFGAGREWSLNLEDGDPVCTDARMVYALQKFLHPVVGALTSLRMMFESGRFAARGLEERANALQDQAAETAPPPTGHSKPISLAGETQVGWDDRAAARQRLAKGTATAQETSPAPTYDEEIAAPLAQARLISTASAKLSYLIDQIVKHQASEQIIVFYESDTTAYHLASVLEIVCAPHALLTPVQLQIQHLIYAKGLTTERRAQYVTTFTHNLKFRVLLMDLTQSAFGLDMQSASRLYFLHPVLSPQVSAQAIGRARRIGQAARAVTVETLVLRGSIEEAIVRRRGEMTHAEVRRCRSIVDDGPLVGWVREAKILPLGEGEGGEGEMERLERAVRVFGRGFGRRVRHPDEDLVGVEGATPVGGMPLQDAIAAVEQGTKRPASGAATRVDGMLAGEGELVPKKRARVRFAEVDDEEGGT
ncbi:SNF2 family N-terminal domain-containing protein [Staphylotrichum tortipilum]|uniref:SNF2 family N-terminal domain-containing protein n=1 Tax=Staphylotrichum tortipilum TaxID=2831512 RepID=A0AAN6MNG0_9PEZI|nr:SNF2 family N-terminal domain-containing protein [Staphylotrichum longicolle]